MNKEDFVPFILDSIGIYPYPELVKLFTVFFENKASKAQLDEVDRHIKATRSKNKVAKAYDEYQERYSLPTNVEKDGE